MNDNNLADSEPVDPLERPPSQKPWTGSIEQSGTADGVLSISFDGTLGLQHRLKQAEERCHEAEVARDKALKQLKSIRDQLPLAVALLDGDGMIFDPQYLSKGEEGGRNAANKLYQGLMGHLDHLLGGTPPGLNLIIFIFLSKYGLMNTLTENDKCNRSEFNSFIKGLVQSHPLINVVDVGPGEERADDKMRDHLWLFLWNFQTRIVFFGGCHDNGYAGTLQKAQTVDLGSKIFLLRGYSDEPIARDIAKLLLPIVEIPGLFIRMKLLPSAPKQDHPSILLSPSFQNVPPPLSPSSLSMTNSPTTKSPRAPKELIQASSPRATSDLCFEYVLSGKCSKGKPDCQFRHSGIVLPEETRQLRQNALAKPCDAVNNGHPCDHDKCIYGHKCPNGPECELYARGKCKFRGDDMHA